VKNLRKSLGTTAIEYLWTGIAEVTLSLRLLRLIKYDLLLAL